MDLPNKLRWDAIIRPVKVVWWVEWVGRVDMRAVVSPILDAACIPKCPSCLRSRARNAGGVGLEEKELVGRTVVDCAPK